MAVKLGQKVKDLVTGFEGVAASIHTYMHGCRRIGVEPTHTDEKGKPIEVRLFDEHRVEIIEDQEIPVAAHMIPAAGTAAQAVADAPGGPRDDDADVVRSSEA